MKYLVAGMALWIGLSSRSALADEPSAGAGTKPSTDTATPLQAADSDDGPPEILPSATGPALPWCAAEVEALTADICFAEGKADATELVIFLHGLVEDGAGWQHAQERGMKAYGKRLGFDVLMPKGRLGLAPSSASKTTIAWPTSDKKRAGGVEDALLDAWRAAREQVEKRRGKPYEKVYVFGFSNGAYYATSLALRGKLAGRPGLDAAGFGVFAGGSGKGFTKGSVAKDKRRMFVAIASKDATTLKNMKSLDKLLRGIGWPHRTVSHPVGHVVGDRAIQDALTYLRGGKAEPVETVASAPKASAKKPGRRAKKR